MSAPDVRGWCPGAHRPMASGDGLVVRVRPPLGELTVKQAVGLADLAGRFGHNELELTNRANLQIRGVEKANHEELLHALTALDLVDADSEVEGRRNVVVDPLRSTSPEDVQTVMAAKLVERLGSYDLHALPSKFGFVVDAGGQGRRLTDVSGDIRIERAVDGSIIVRVDGLQTGRAVRDDVEAVFLALEIARWFLASGGVGSDGRGRMAQHIAAGATLPEDLSGSEPPAPAASRPVPGQCEDGFMVGLAFGLLPVAGLVAIANASKAALRITPWRMIFLPGPCEVPDFHEQEALLTNPQDPLLRVHACTGSPGCAQSTVPTRELARGLAGLVPDSGTLHVSGCSKGCAHPRPADITLVGRAGRFDLVKHGAPWDDPMRCGIEPQHVAKVFSG